MPESTKLPVCKLCADDSTHYQGDIQTLACILIDLPSYSLHDHDVDVGSCVEYQVAGGLLYKQHSDLSL